MSNSYPLIHAIRTGNTKGVEYCMGHSDFNPTGRDDFGRTALMWAASKGCEDFVKLLMSHSDLLAQDTSGKSALMMAASNGHEQCVGLLLPGSNPLTVDRDGNSALMLASLNGHEDCAMLLLPKSDPLTLNLNELSADKMAAVGGHDALSNMIHAYVLARRESTVLHDHVSTESLQEPRTTSTLRI